MEQVMLTTIDNPFDPFTEEEQWERYDTDHGYYSREYVARLTKTSHELSDEDYHNEIVRAIDWIVENDPFLIFRKVVKK